MSQSGKNAADSAEKAAILSAVSSVEPERPLRILFVVQHGALLRFSLLIPALAQRGHEIHIAFPRGAEWERRRYHRVKRSTEPPLRTKKLLRELKHDYKGQITHGPAAVRGDLDPWSTQAWLVRGIADLAHNADPRYRKARGLQMRTKKRVLGRITKRGEFEPLARLVAQKVGRKLIQVRTDKGLSKRTLRRARVFEDAIPASRPVTRFVRGLRPDIVLTTGTFRHVSGEIEVLKSARKLGIPSGIFVTSWDNLTNKGSLKFVPELVFVWNEVQARDANELHGIPRDRIRITGAHVFDEWFARRPTRTREQFLADMGLDPGRPYVVYLCSSGNIAQNEEPEFIRRWIEALRSSDDPRLREMGVLVRPHPNVRNRPRDLGYENVAVYPPDGAYPVAEHARNDFVDTLSHCSAVVGMNTTAMIEAACLGKSVMTVLVPEFAQQTTLHFHYLLAENGGFLHVARDLDEHTRQLGSVLDEDAEGEKLRRRFVESFVRPNGLDRPAAPIAAEAIEELAGKPVERRLRPKVLGLRLLLSIEAAFNVVWELYRRVVEYFKDAAARRRLANAVPVEPGAAPQVEQPELTRR